MPTSVTLIPTITEAGIEAAGNAQGTGIQLPITHVGFGTGAYVPTGSETALVDEVSRVAIAGGGKTSPTSIQVYAQVEAPAGAPFFCSEIGFYSNATLVAVFSQTSAPILYISDVIVTAVTYALGLAAIPPNTVSVTVDPSASAALAALGAHVADPNAHLQYVPRLTGIGVYDPTLTYGVQAVAIGDDGRLYQSLQAANTGNTPSASLTWWGPVSTITATQPAHVVPLSQVQALILAAFSAEAGKVAAFAMSTAPTGWLKANGAAVSRTAYANLFAQIGSTYGAGDGSTTFNLPDYRGEFLRGFDDGRGVDAGRTLGSFQADSFASHAHPVTDPTHGHAVADPTHAHPVTDPTHSHSDPNTVSNQPGSQLNGVPSTSPNTAVGTQTNASSTGISINAAATGIGIYGAATGISIQANGGTETRPKNVAALYCIKY
ncbi:tail fiber protein [Paraburkholderia sediminicola]|uniref:tail fiber protein n=1 Tax=Paraburkholderia sediminicola TaxID=458836 RepID=UPI0038B6C423